MWVLTREPNGDVLMWETTKGKYYTLPQRWSGLLLDGVDNGAVKAAAKREAEARAKKEKVLLDGPKKRRKPRAELALEAVDPRKARAAAAMAAEKAARDAATAAERAAKLASVEEKLLYLDQPETAAQFGGETNAFETPRDFDERRRVRRASLARGVSPTKEAQEVRSRMKQTLMKAVKAQGALDAISQKNDARLAAQAEASASASASGLALAGDDGYEPGSPEPGGGGLAPASVALLRAAGGAEEGMPPLLELLPCERLPFESLEVLVNTDNVWANVQAYDVTKLAFDLEDEARWKPFIKPGIFEPPPPQPFYSLGAIAPKLPKTRLEALRATLLRHLRGAYEEWRRTRSMGLRWIHRLEPTLEEGLLLHERARQTSDIKAVHAIDRWKGTLIEKCPADTKFTGRALTFSIQDPKIITEQIMEQFPYHEEAHRDVKFALAVQAFPHYCAVCAMWVYIGIVIPHKSKKDKEKEEEEEKKKRRAEAKVNVKGSLQANQ